MTEVEEGEEEEAGEEEEEEVEEGVIHLVPHFWINTDRLCQSRRRR